MSYDLLSLGESASLKGGKRLPKGKMLTSINTGHPYIRITDIHNHKIDTRNILFVTKEDQEKISRYIVSTNDLILTIVGTIGLVAIVPEALDNANLTENCIKIKLQQDKLLTKFVYYFLTSKEGQDQLHSLNVGSTQPKLPLYNIAKLEIPLPPLPEQQAIAEVLSSIDDKIDLLHRNNKTLEEMAETLFRQWFVEVETLPTSIVMKIDEVAEMQNGYSFKSSEFVEVGLDTIEVMKMGHISPGGGLRSSPKKDFVKRTDKLNKWKLNKRDIVLCMTDMKDNVVVLGVPALVDKDDKYVLNQRVGRIFLKHGSPLADILILFMQMREKVFINELQSKANSGVQVNLGTDTIRETQILVPDTKQQNLILPKLQCLFDKLELNREQISQLEKTKDSLLPKLMSGQVRVNF
jgi:type I restriction enzyme S subunit